MVDYRVVVLGDGGVGKTALSVQVSLLWAVLLTYHPTIEDSYRKQLIVDKKMCLMEVIEDENSLPSLDDEAMTLTKSENGTHSFIALSAAKAKASLVKDEDFSWEEFNQANFRMVNAMHQCEWAEEQVQMHIDLWLAIEMHDWRHDTSPFNKAALLTYQA
ncbi:hypothetical protein BU15DRAFT_63330 [Melanogaster broomeanus]|nr:hypothetical protein BU15DRAFT_63330 [Melanogaster broomeanus]